MLRVGVISRFSFSSLPPFFYPSSAAHYSKEKRLSSVTKKATIKHFSSNLTKMEEFSSQVCVAEPEETFSGGEKEPGSGLRSEDTVKKYGYLSHGYSTELFKIQLSNIPLHMGYKKLRDYLTSLELTPGKIKQPGRLKGVAFINFKNEEERQKAVEALNGRTWKNRVLGAKFAQPAADPLYLRKRSMENEAGSLDNSKRARLDPMTLKERLFESVCPWADLPYEEQLRRKEVAMKKALKQMSTYLSKRDYVPGPWIEEQKQKNEGIFCRVDPIKASPVVEKYRNKCEFCVGYGPEDAEESSVMGTEKEGGESAELKDGQEGGESAELKDGQEGGEGELAEEKRKVVVGFRTGTYEEGDFSIVSGESCPHIPDRTKELAELFQVFFNKSSLEPYLSSTSKGYWRGFAVRCYGTGDTMVTVQMHPQSLTAEEIQSLKSSLVDFFTTGEGSKAPPTSLYFELQGRKMSSEIVLPQHLLGATHVHEDLLGMKFRIAATSFFQVNTAACGVLYDTIKDIVQSDVGSNPVILDFCCGTGTIGLYLSKMLSTTKVVGIEMVPAAVEDARHNAAVNGVTNAEFVCGKVESVIKDQLWRIASGNVIGILDPPRGGLHGDVIRAIRKCPSIRKLIYVSCKPDNAGPQTNITSLCKMKSNNIKGEPFRPVKAIPMDLFPQTPHCELVIVLEREPLVARLAFNTVHEPMTKDQPDSVRAVS